MKSENAVWAFQIPEKDNSAWDFPRAIDRFHDVIEVAVVVAKHPNQRRQCFPP